MTHDATNTAVANARQALADLYAAAVAALDATERKERVQSAIGHRCSQAGATQAGAELAFAVLIAAQHSHKPEGVSLAVDKEPSFAASDAVRALGTLVRRIRDSL